MVKRLTQNMQRQSQRAKQTKLRRYSLVELAKKLQQMK